MSSVTPSGSTLNKLLKLVVLIILCCIAAEMIKTTFYSTVLPMLPWIIGGALVFFVLVYIWNRMRNS